MKRAFYLTGSTPSQGIDYVFYKVLVIFSTTDLGEYLLKKAGPYLLR